jgi:hypothetical protein
MHQTTRRRQNDQRAAGDARAVDRVKDPELLGRARDVLNHARRAGMLIVRVKVGFRPHLPEISSTAEMR